MNSNRTLSFPSGSGWSVKDSRKVSAGVAVASAAPNADTTAR